MWSDPKMKKAWQKEPLQNLYFAAAPLLNAQRHISKSGLPWLQISGNRIF